MIDHRRTMKWSEIMGQLLSAAGPALVVVAACFHLLCRTAVAAPPFELWTFDNTTTIGGHKVTVVGHPRVIDTPMGKGVEVNGKDDALILDVRPLAGAETFTCEVIFRPDADGAPEQRFFHLQENGTDNRLLFEIRLTDGRWYLDSFAKSGAAARALMHRKLLHGPG